MRIAILLVLAACTEQDPSPPSYAWDLPPGFPEPRVPAENPMTPAKVNLGRHLFYDTRLSGNETQSCATCHRQELAFTDGGATSVGSTGERGRRSAMSLANVAYAPGLTWDARVQSLEEQALVPMYGRHPIELGLEHLRDRELTARLTAVPRYTELFSDAFPDDADPISVTNIARALATFQRTLISGRSRFDRFVAGDTTALTEQEQAGSALFASDAFNCAFCHGDFTGSRTDLVLFNTGLYYIAGDYPDTDRGLVEITGDAKDIGRFRPPTLRNIAITAPYQHDGSAPTLDDVLDAYARGGRLTTTGPNTGDGSLNPHKAPQLRGFDLSDDDRAALVAFLGALTDEDFLTNPSLGNPW